ncbi:MAG TPA: SWIM zinc finger family protein [Lamprocystis sp. (in: g-proteobacteria)]|nr:SWIM zinc finger family protein [Lamprocystis sp. (in: g-proteobacteria)]
MASLGKTWWGQRFIAALEGFTDRGRLARGRGYCSDRRILKFDIADGVVTATVRGNVNPYYGVSKEPRYTTKIQMAPIPAPDWQKAIAYLGGRAGFVCKLLLNEMPDTIDAAFAHVKLPLLPHDRKDFRLTNCSCPDAANPCKHIAGVYYRLAAQLDHDPFLLFELRGLSRAALRESLSRTPLGEALAGIADDHALPVVAADSYYTRPLPASASPDYRSFWQGRQRLPTEVEPATPTAVPGILIKKAGDFPAFWDQEGSFIAVMEEIYLRVRTKNKEAL